MSNYNSRAGEVVSRIQELVARRDLEFNEQQTAQANPSASTSQLIFGWMQEAGLKTRIDAIGNIRGWLPSQHQDAKTMVLGSHFEAPRNTGRFDGSLGVVCAIDLAKNLVEQRINLPFHIEVVAFCEADGARFHTSFLGSKAFTGKLRSTLLDRRDDENIRLEDYLLTRDKDFASMKKDAMIPQNCLGYYEINMEQGPILYKQGLAVSAVKAIAGRKQIEIIFEGKAGHAGTIPMEYRKDALCGASEFILAAEEYAEPARRNVLVTVGRISVKQAAANRIPGRVSCTLDIRSADPARLEKAYEALNKICERICHRRGLYFEWKLLQEIAPVFCDESMLLKLGLGIRAKSIDLIELVSGASHDAAIVASIAPVSMLFVKGFKGSYQNNEMAEAGDIAVALEVSDTFLHSLAKDIRENKSNA